MSISLKSRLIAAVGDIVVREGYSGRETKAGSCLMVCIRQDVKGKKVRAVN